MREGRLREATRAVGTVLALGALLASAAYGGDLLGLRTRLQGSDVPPARAPALGRAATDLDPAAVEAERTRVRSAPWWQDLRVLTGDGPSTATLPVDETALQWRASWSCERGELIVTVPRRDPAAGGATPAPLVRASCPAEGTATSTDVGDVPLDVRADGPWELHAEQQLDVPLVEPPLPEATAPGATTLATGTFYDVDQTGRGEVTVTRLPDGRHVLRLDGFFVTPNIDLQIHLSPVDGPRSTEEFRSEPSAYVAPLETTTGAMNFVLPADVDPTRYRSVVIWCPPVQNTYAAARLVAVGG